MKTVLKNMEDFISQDMKREVKHKELREAIQKSPYTFVKWQEAIDLSNDLYKDNVAIKSKLISSRGWDMALKFIEKLNPTFPTARSGVGWINGVEGNVPKLIGKDLDKNISNMQNNIYDMAGNLMEWTADIYPTDSRLRGFRGGVCLYSWPACCRDFINPHSIYYDIYQEFQGFRVALYIK